MILAWLILSPRMSQNPPVCLAPHVHHAPLEDRTPPKPHASTLSSKTAATLTEKYVCIRKTYSGIIRMTFCIFVTIFMYYLRLLPVLSSFIHPHVDPNRCKILSYVEHKLRYFEKPVSYWSPLTSIVGKEIIWPINRLITSILQNIFLYVQHKKETHTGLEWHEGE